MRLNEMRKIEIFDTTLRDGEQASIITLSPLEKFAIAQSLEKLGVDVIEAGFPNSSEGDYESVERIAKGIKGPSIAGLARIDKEEVDVTWNAIKYADNPILHIFASTSPEHMNYKLKMAPEEVHKKSVEIARYAKKIMDGRGDLEFSCEDGTRSDRKFVAKIFGDVIAEGVNTINFPDTVGYAATDEFRGMVKYFLQNVPGIEKAKFSVHCHDDLGLAVANSMIGISAGAGQVEVAVNGIGERGGNAALEEVVAGLKTRPDYYDAYTNVNTEFLNYISKQVSRLTGMLVQPNKAIVGANAFAHRAGIHQDGALKDRRTYEIMKPGEYGWAEESIIITNKSGKSGIRKVLKEVGYNLSDDELKQTYKIAMDIADKKRTLSSEDLMVIVDEEVRKAPEIIRLIDFHVTTGMNITPSGMVRLSYNGREKSKSAIGDGPIDAVYLAINSALGIETDITRFNIHAITGGKDALGEVRLFLKYNGTQVMGRGISTDIIEASAKAYVSAVNKMMYMKGT